MSIIQPVRKAWLKLFDRYSYRIIDQRCERCIDRYSSRIIDRQFMWSIDKPRKRTPISLLLRAYADQFVIKSLSSIISWIQLLSIYRIIILITWIETLSLAISSKAPKPQSNQPSNCLAHNLLIYIKHNPPSLITLIRFIRFSSSLWIRFLSTTIEPLN